MRHHAVQKKPAAARMPAPAGPALAPARGFGPAAPMAGGAGHDLSRMTVRPRNQTGLDDRLKTGIERLSGVSMDDVRVHYRSSKPAEVEAAAYTQGTHIHVAPGQEKHLAHEAWHVVQQKQRRVRPTLRTLGAPINDDRGLEAEAHTMGERALRVAPSGPAAGPAAGPVAAAQPGWSVSAPAQMLVGQSRFNWGIWARGGGSITDNQHLQDIHDALGRYHPERRATESAQQFADRRAQALDEAQRGVHRYLGGLGDLQHGGMPRDYMLGMLDDLQQEHVQHIDYTHRNNLNLYSSEALSHAERQQLNQDWDEVRGGAGTIRLPQGAQHAGDNMRTRASFARLMSKQHGRQLVRGLLTPSQNLQGGNWRVDVSYTPRLTDQERAAVHVNRAAYQRLRPAYEAAAARLQAPNVTQEHEDEFVRLQEQINPYRVGQRGYRTELEEAAAAGERPHGANLRILTGLKDSEFLNHSGVRTGLIAGPSHILTGHELVHALHYKQGTRDLSPEYGAASPHRHWDNPEERQTISTGVGPTENRLRGEHDLTAREGHTSKRRADLDAEETRRRRRAAAPWVVGGLAAAAYTGYRLWYG
jgi:hypothetical protein